MNNAPVQVIVAAFKTQDGAKEAYQTLEVIKREKLLIFRDAALLYRDLRNKIHIQEMNYMRGIQGAIAGGLVGIGIALATRRATWLVAGAVGAAAGGLLARHRDSGLPNEPLKNLAETVDILVSTPHFYPSNYPMAFSDKMHILHKGYSLREKVAVVLDEWFVLPQLEKLYQWSTEWLEVPELTRYIIDGQPSYPCTQERWSNQL